MADVAKATEGATPRPWARDPKASTRVRHEATDRGIAATGGYQTNMVDPEAVLAENEANTALIVQAVNTYEAHEALADLVRSIENDAEQVPAWLWGRIQDALARLDAIEGGGA